MGEFYEEHRSSLMSWRFSGVSGGSELKVAYLFVSELVAVLVAKNAVALNQSVITDRAPVP
jgi:hypothetical protein